ncbi:SLAM family member 8-like [Balearica regulorum gibbericeps]|uniref:SLAM family member 8-like n=1 Tax=Balearica regulorum gibbericeps TaxID=100784 RepID=UPI003F6395F6
MSPGRPRPRVPRLLALLLVAAGTAATQPRQVNGVLGGSVLLSPVLPPNKTVKKIEWSFSSGTGTTIQVAEFGPGSFERPDPKDRFKDRLEMVNETALRIGVLERGDSGVYGARIKLHPALVEDQSFHLTVYEPVPVPEIQHQQLSLTTQGCNITLRCWVPPGSGAQAAWQLGSSGRTRWGQLCEDGRSLCLAVPIDALNSSYTCVARNPVQERGVSIRTDALCRHRETGGWQKWHVCLALLPAAFPLGICLWTKRRRRKQPREVRGSTCPLLPALPGPGRLSRPAPPRHPPGSAPHRSSPGSSATERHAEENPPGGGGAAGPPPPHHLQPAAGSRAETFAEPTVAARRGAPSPHDTGQERAPHDAVA